MKKPTMEPVFIIRTAGIKKRWEVKENGGSKYSETAGGTWTEK